MSIWDGLRCQNESLKSGFRLRNRPRSTPSRRAAHGHRHGATLGGGPGYHNFPEAVLHAPWIDFIDPGCFGKVRL